MLEIGFIGLGNMGLPMAKNLVAAGHKVTGFDRVDTALAELVAAGGQGAANVNEAVAKAEIVVTMLPAGRHVEEVYLGADGIVGAVPEGSLLIDSSTIDVATARRVSDAAAQKGFAMVDAPVSGGVGGATAGTLTFMVGGIDDAFARARPVLEVMGKNIFHAGAKYNNNKLFSNGGRVLNFTSLGKNFFLIRKRIIKLINILKWKEGFFRKDIGWKVIN